MAKPKKKKSRRKARNYCACPGVDMRTGRVLRGFRANKRGGCPIPIKRTSGGNGRKGKKKFTYSTGSSYNKAAIEAIARTPGSAAYKARAEAEADWGRMASGVNGLRGLAHDVRRRIALRRAKGWYRT
jgi:hypothetical protein